MDALDALLASPPKGQPDALDALLASPPKGTTAPNLMAAHTPNLPLMPAHTPGSTTPPPSPSPEGVTSEAVPFEGMGPAVNEVGRRTVHDLNAGWLAPANGLLKLGGADWWGKYLTDPDGTHPIQGMRQLPQEMARQNEKARKASGLGPAGNVVADVASGTLGMLAKLPAYSMLGEAMVPGEAAGAIAAAPTLSRAILQAIPNWAHGMGAEAAVQAYGTASNPLTGGMEAARAYLSNTSVGNLFRRAEMLPGGKRAIAGTSIMLGQLFTDKLLRGEVPTAEEIATAAGMGLAPVLMDPRSLAAPGHAETPRATELRAPKGPTPQDLTGIEAPKPKQLFSPEEAAQVEAIASGKAEPTAQEIPPGPAPVRDESAPWWQEPARRGELGPEYQAKVEAMDAAATAQAEAATRKETPAPPSLEAISRTVAAMNRGAERPATPAQEPVDVTPLWEAQKQADTQAATIRVPAEPLSAEPVPPPERRAGADQAKAALRAAWDALTPEEQFDKAHSDAKTQIYNADALATIRTEHEAGRLPGSWLFLDGDGFGKINKRYGQDAGDAVIRTMGEVVRRRTGQADITAGRPGGDEVALLLHGEGATFSPEIGAAIERDLAKSRWKFTDLETGEKVTHKGLSVTMGEGPTYADASATQYAAKQAKRAAAQAPGNASGLPGQPPLPVRGNRAGRRNLLPGESPGGTAAAEVAPQSPSRIKPGQERAFYVYKTTEPRPAGQPDFIPAHEFVRVKQAYPVRLSADPAGDLDLFVFRNGTGGLKADSKGIKQRDGDGTWSVSDARTGLRITNGHDKTRTDAIAQAEMIVANRGLEATKARIKEAASQYGLSPRYESQGTLPPGTQAHAKEPWQMTREEYAATMPPIPRGASKQVKAMMDGELLRMRRAHVERALSEGKPVPPEVLADYPELGKKAESPQEIGSPAPTRPSETGAVPASGRSTAANTGAELINYGGVATTRTEVYRQALEATGDKKAAEFFAFGPQAKALSPDEAKALVRPDALRTAANKARARLKDPTVMNDATQVLADYATIGAEHLRNGLTKFTEWSRAMLQEFGAKVRPYLAKAWEMAKKAATDERGYFKPGQLLPEGMLPEITSAQVAEMSGAKPAEQARTPEPQNVEPWNPHTLPERPEEGFSELAKAVRSPLQALKERTYVPPELRSKDVGVPLPIHAPRTETLLRDFGAKVTLMSHLARKFPKVVKPFWDAYRIGQREKFQRGQEFADAAKPFFELSQTEKERVGQVAYMIEGATHIPEGDPAEYMRRFGLSRHEAEGLVAIETAHEQVRQHVLGVFTSRFKDHLRGEEITNPEAMVRDLLDSPGDAGAVQNIVANYRAGEIAKEVRPFMTRQGARNYLDILQKANKVAYMQRAEGAKGKWAVVTITDPLVQLAYSFRQSVAPWISHVPHYQPHTRYGNYAITIYAKDAEEGALPLFFGTYETPREFHDAMRALTEGRQKVREWISDGKGSSIAEDSAYDPENHMLLTGNKATALYENKAGVQMKMMSAFLDGLPLDAEMDKFIKARLLDYVRSKGYGAHHIHRAGGATGIPGFSTDIARTNADSLAAAAGWLGKVKMFDGYSRAKEDVSIHSNEQDQPVLWKHLNDWMGYTLDSSKDPYATLKAINFHMVLGGSLKSASVNLTSMATMAYPELGKVTSAPSVKLVRASKDWIVWKRNGSGLSAEDAAAMTWAEGTGELGAQLEHQLMGTTGNPVYKAAKLGMQKVSKVSGFLFGTVEEFNRGSTFLAAFRAYRAKGEAPEVARESALELVDRAHFAYSKGDRPVVGRGLGSLPYQFRAYQWHYWTWVMENMAGAMHKDKSAMAALARNLATTGALSGLMGSGAGDAFKWAYQKALGKDPEEELRQWSALLARGVFRGVPAMGGFDISGSLNPADTGFRVRGNGEDATWAALAKFFIGPTAGLVSAGWRASKSLAEGKPLRAVEDLAPNAIKSPLAALRLGTQGSTTRSGAPDMAMNPKTGKMEPFKLSPVEATGKALGFQPTRLNERYDTAANIKAARDRRSSKLDDLSAKFAGAIATKNQAARKAAADELRAYNAKMKKEGRPAELIAEKDLVSSVRGKLRPQYPGGSRKAYQAYTQ